MSRLPYLFLAHRYISRHEQEGTQPPRWVVLLFGLPAIAMTGMMAVLAAGIAWIALSIALGI